MAMCGGGPPCANAAVLEYLLMERSFSEECLLFWRFDVSALYCYKECLKKCFFSPGNCLRDVNLAKTPQAGVVHERKDHWSDWRLPSVHLLKVACVLFCSKAGNLNFTQFWLTGSRV